MYNPYSIMYDAKMTLFHWEDDTISSISHKKKSKAGEDIPCRYSVSGLTAAGTPDPSIKTQHTLFCGREVPVHEGDEAAVTLRDGTVLTLRIGEAHPYTYQWQCEVTRSDHT